MKKTEANKEYDYAVIGCGMAGASIAYQLSQSGSAVVVLEAEPYAAYHTTGRSAAFYMEAYGNATVRQITQAGRPFFENPPEGFCEVPLLKPCGALYIARDEQKDSLRKLYQELKPRIPDCELVDQDFLLEKLPALREDTIQAGFWEPQSMEIDVAALLEGYIKGAKTLGTEFLYKHKIQSMSFANSLWNLDTKDEETIQAKTVINAAGAWADHIAELAGANSLKLEPKKRTVCVAKPKGDTAVNHWPLTLDIGEQFYFKPEGNNLLITPADEQPSEAHDAQADEYDVALGIDRLQQAVDIEFSSIVRQWAGLRTFSQDRSPVVGYDNTVENFFWLAGQGGYGIQMAPALAELASALVQKQSIDEDIKQAICSTRFD